MPNNADAQSSLPKIGIQLKFVLFELTPAFSQHLFNNLTWSTHRLFLDLVEAIE